MTKPVSVTTTELQDGSETFTVTIVKPEKPDRYGLFAAGRGGNPARHLGLLKTVASRGCALIAPHFQMLTNTAPSAEDLGIRIRQLDLSADRFAEAGQPVFGIGHSIGTVALLALAGGRACTLARDTVAPVAGRRLERLALLAPIADFFKHPGALDSVAARMYLRTGSLDHFAPPAQVRHLGDLLARRTQVDLHIDREAGHFSYMDDLPPNFDDPLPDRAGFLAALATSVAMFVSAAD